MESSLKSRAEPSRIALLGFGTVGQSVARILCSGEVRDVRLTHIFNRHVGRKRADWVPSSVCWTDSVADIIASDVDIVVEVVGGRHPAGEISQVEASAQRLWVAGGPTGHAYVYSTRDGSTIADLVLNSAGGSLINDVMVTEDAAFFTDTFRSVIYRIPLGPGGSIGSPQTIPLSGPAAVVGDFPNLNGIAAPSDGKVLILGHSSRAELYLVDPSTGSSRTIALSGGALIPGTPDLFRVPTAVAEDGHRLALVNARFDLGFPPPFGPGAPPGTDFNVVQLDKP